MGVAVSDSKSKCVFPDTAWVNFDIWLYIELGFAVLNLIFAPYFQHQVWLRINSDENRDQFRDGDQAASNSKVQAKGASSTTPVDDAVVPTAGEITIPPKIVQDSFKKTFMEDFGVLFYIVALIGAFVVTSFAADWIKAGTDCDSSIAVGLIRFTGMAFFSIVAVYTFCWWCCKCCAKSIVIKKDLEIKRDLESKASEV